jgi:hypothetical protein
MAPARGRFADTSMYRNMPENSVPVDSTVQPARLTIRAREYASK